MRAILHDRPPPLRYLDRKVARRVRKRSDGTDAIRTFLYIHCLLYACMYTSIMAVIVRADATHYSRLCF